MRRALKEPADWIIMDMWALDPDKEQATLDRVGLTEAEVLALVG